METVFTSRDTVGCILHFLSSVDVFRNRRISRMFEELGKNPKIWFHEPLLTLPTSRCHKNFEFCCFRVLGFCKNLKILCTKMKQLKVSSVKKRYGKNSKFYIVILSRNPTGFCAKHGTSKKQNMSIFPTRFDKKEIKNCSFLQIFPEFVIEWECLINEGWVDFKGFRLSQNTTNYVKNLIARKYLKKTDLEENEKIKNGSDSLDQT